MGLIMLNPHPIRSGIRDEERAKIHLGLCSLLVRAFPERSTDVLIWRTILCLRKYSWIPKKAPPCARIAWKNPTRKKREEWCPDLKCPNVRFFAVSEFVRGLIGATCGQENPMRILREVILMDVDPWPIFLHLARTQTGQDFAPAKIQKQNGRPRGSKNKKTDNVIELDSFRRKRDPVNRAA